MRQLTLISDFVLRERKQKLRNISFFFFINNIRRFITGTLTASRVFMLLSNILKKENKKNLASNIIGIFVNSKSAHTRMYISKYI